MQINNVMNRYNNAPIQKSPNTTAKQKDVNFTSLLLNLDLNKGLNEIKHTVTPENLAHVNNAFRRGYDMISKSAELYPAIADEKVVVEIMHPGDCATMRAYVRAAKGPENLNSNGEIVDGNYYFTNFNYKNFLDEVNTFAEKVIANFK